MIISRITDGYSLINLNMFNWLCAKLRSSTVYNPDVKSLVSMLKLLPSINSLLKTSLSNKLYMRTETDPEFPV